jgi:hypothetical protein
VRLVTETSICVPEDEALRLHVDASAREARSEGKTRVSVSPLEIELPTMVVSLGRVTIKLPTARFHAMVYGVPVVETPAGGQRQLPVGQQGAGQGYASAERLNRASRPPVFVETDVDWGKTEVEVEEMKTSMTPTRVHATAVKGNDQPFWVEMDLDQSKVKAGIAAVDAFLQGCVVIDG